MRRSPATRQGQRMRSIRLAELPPPPPRRPGERLRTFAPLPPPVNIWQLPAPELTPGAALRRLIAPRPSIAWRLTRGALLFFCAFSLTALTLLAAAWLEQPAAAPTQTTAATPPAAPRHIAD